MQAVAAQARLASVSQSLAGRRLAARCGPVRAARPATLPVLAAAAAETEERFRLNNLSPQPGAKKARKRKGRGYGAGQGGSCGMGMRGQKSRSGSGIRPGFEGGQTPLYRRLPKLKGIAGGMGAGQPDYVVINLRDLAAFAAGETVSLDTLAQRSLINLSGREARLPLKVLGTGELSSALTVQAAAFSEAARAKIEAAGGKAEELPQKAKWTRKLGEQRKAAAAKAAPAKAKAAK